MGPSEAVGEAQRRRRADPAGEAVDGSDPAVEGLGELEGDEGETRADVFEEDLVEPFAGLAENAEGGVDALGLQGLKTAAGDPGVRIDRPDDDPGGPAGDQGFDAGRGTAVMAAGFEGDIDGRPGDRFRGAADRVDFGVGPAAALVPALADDPAVPDDHSADERVGAHLPFTLPGKPQRPTHEPLIFPGAARFGHLVISLPGSMRPVRRNKQVRPILSRVRAGLRDITAAPGR